MMPPMDSPKLRKLTRAQLQSLAKQESVRAVGKTEDIIRRLIQKHPKGVPVHKDVDNPSASSAPLTQSAPKSSQDADPKGKGKAVAETVSPSPSNSSGDVELLLYPEDEPVAGPSEPNFESASASHPKVAESRALPNYPISFSGRPSPVSPSGRQSHQAPTGDAETHGAPLPEASNPDAQTDEEDELEDDPKGVYDDIDYPNYPKGAPNHYMVVDALRQFTSLTNMIPTMEAHIAESRCLLQRTDALLVKVMPDARELAITREYLETFLLAKMKQKRELWDGTAKMNKQDRKVRMEWLRAERKVEAEKKWRETNELLEKNGFKPEPFSAFASQSDEEVIESLQTTPASSRSGGSKRAREGSDGEGSDVGANTDGESRPRKRACA